LAGKSKSGVVSGIFNIRAEAADGKKSPRVGFVPQQDILPPTLTVFEALLFAARLRLPDSVTDKEKHERVSVLLEMLGISAIKDARIGDVTGGKARGISGGEMRRVSIGLELISSPDVLLLDEPTSGLDSVSAARVADVLHAIAHDPVNPTPIIASVHQPRCVPFPAHQLSCILLTPIPALNYIKSSTFLSFYPMVARFTQVQALLPLRNTSQPSPLGRFRRINKATTSQSIFSKWPAIRLSVYSKCGTRAQPLSIKMVLALGWTRANPLKKIPTDPPSMLMTLTRRLHRCCTA